MGFVAVTSFLQETIAGLVAATVLVYLLALLNVVEAIDVERSDRRALVGVIVPLLIAFVGITIYHSLLALRWIR